MLGLSGKARGLDMILDPLVGVNKGRSIFLSRCVTYVSAVTFNWLSKRSNCYHVTDQKTLELFRNVSAAVSEMTRNWKKIREGRKLREDNFKYRPKR